MTDTPREMDPREEDAERAEQQERADLDPAEQPNAPNREPTTERVGPDDSPGPPDPGTIEPDLPAGVESYERPGRDGNWDDSETKD